MQHRHLSWIIGSVLFISSGTHAEAPSKTEVIQLDDITVKGESLDVMNNPFTVNVLDTETIRQQRVDLPLRLIEKVPGMDLAGLRQGGVADNFTIRGFKNSGHGGDAAVYIDGIPLNEGESHADGYADTNVLIPLELDRLTVYKGPVSPLYGNFARGGALAFKTRHGGEYQEIEIATGAYDTFDAQAAIGGKLGELKTNFAMQTYHTTGWQENSKYLKGTLAGHIAYDINDRTEIVLSLRAHAGDWHAPGYIPKAQFDDKEGRSHQAIYAQNDGGNKHFLTERVDVNYEVDNSTKLLVFAYGTQQEFTRFAKFGYTPGGQREDFNDRGVLGLGSSLNGTHSVMELPIHWVSGLEYYDEDTIVRRWSTENRVRINQRWERDVKIQTLSGFAQADVKINPYFRPNLGIRYDRFSGDYDNRDSGNLPFKNNMPHYDHLSPKLGLRSTLSPQWELRASVVNGYALPEAEAKYDPAFNLKPVSIWQYEVGINGKPTTWSYVDLATFVIDTSNEILENPIGSGTFRNVGETRRTGLEADIRVYPMTHLEIAATFSLLNSEIRANPDPSLIGKKVVGVPRHIATLQLTYAGETGLGYRLNWRQVGSYPLTDANTEKYNGYNLVNIGLFYNQKLQGNRNMRYYIDLNNALDTKYAQAVFSGFGTINYAPGLPRHIMAGLAISF